MSKINYHIFYKVVICSKYYYIRIYVYASVFF